MIDLPRVLDIVHKLVREPEEFLDYEEHTDLDEFILRMETLRHAGATMRAHGFGYMDINIDRSFVLQPTFEVAGKFGSAPQRRFEYLGIQPPMLSYSHWVDKGKLVTSVCVAYALVEGRNQRVETMLLRPDLQEPLRGYPFLSQHETLYVELPPRVAVVAISTWPESDLWHPNMFGVIFDRTTRTA